MRLAVVLAALSGCTLLYSRDGYDVGPRGDGGAPESGAGGDALSPSDATSYRNVVLADAPRAYWRLGEASGVVAKDEAGGHDGTYRAVDLSVPGAIAGDADSAVGFRATMSAIVVGNVLDLVGNAPFSLEVWARPSLVDTTDRRIFTKRTTDGTRDEGWSLVHDADRHLAIETFAGGAWAGGGFTPVGLPLNVYTHVVVTYDSVTLRFYFAGEEVAQFVTRIALNGNEANLVIGALSDAQGNFWRGDLDEAAIYDHALSRERVRAHHLAGTSPTSGAKLAP